jgi:Trk K+ transport system NAD-binding subunit
LGIFGGHIVSLNVVLVAVAKRSYFHTTHQKIVRTSSDYRSRILKIMGLGGKLTTVRLALHGSSATDHAIETRHLPKTLPRAA